MSLYPKSPRNEVLAFARMWQFIGWLMVAIVVILTLIPKPPELGFVPASDKAHHLIAYAGLMFWFRQAFAKRPGWIVFLVLLGISLEFVQDWLGHRYFEYTDMLANTLGVGCGLLLASTPLGSMVAWLDRTLVGLRVSA